MTLRSTEVIVADIQVIQRQMSNCVYRFASNCKLIKARDTPWVKFVLEEALRSKTFQTWAGPQAAAVVGRKENKKDL